jgi:hypothetical protein
MQKNCHIPGLGWIFNRIKIGGSQAMISLENTQIRRYALEPAGTLIFRCWSLFSDGV